MCQKVSTENGMKTYFYYSEYATWYDAYKGCTKNSSANISHINQNEFVEIAPNNTSIWNGLKSNTWNVSCWKPHKNCTSDDISNTIKCLEINEYSNNSSGRPDSSTQSVSSSMSATVKPPMILLSSGTTTSNTLSWRPDSTTQSVRSSMSATVKPPMSLLSSGTTTSNTLAYNLTLLNQTKNWIGALLYCQEYHKTLVHIVNDTVQDYVVQMLQNEVYPNGVWIGLERNILFMCAPWLWTGGPYVNFSNWNSTFPVDPTSQFCGKIIGNKAKWLDAYCGEELPFICQN
ncbi:C-type mannose receptor 2-like isoform X2 [Hoplias malabaricus]